MPSSEDADEGKYCERKAAVSHHGAKTLECREKSGSLKKKQKGVSNEEGEGQNLQVVEVDAWIRHEASEDR